MRTLRGARSEVNWVMSNTSHGLELVRVGGDVTVHCALVFVRMRCGGAGLVFQEVLALKERGKEGLADFEIALARQRQSGI